jgi:succinate dehydrogenase/fumarate reductase flavoprotein subunit
MSERIIHETDVLVVGGGIAGVFAAIRASESGERVLLADKSFFGRSGTSSLASGVFCAYMPGDDMKVWLESLGGPLVNNRVLEKSILVTHDLLMLMDRWGVKWVKEGGKIARSGGAFGVPFPTNAMMAEGGPQMMMALRNEALRRGVEVVNRVMVTDLLTSDGNHSSAGSVIGAIGFGAREGEIHVFKAKATIQCAGPIRFPYPRAGWGFQGMPINVTGDGVAAALRAGANLGKMELGGISPFPAEFYCAPALEMGSGLGVRFVNAKGEDFILSAEAAAQAGQLRQHLTWEKSRRSQLAAGIVREYQEGRGPVHLDMTHLTPEQMRLYKQVVPIVLTTFERAGYNLAKERIPYVNAFPAETGVAGAGIKINEFAETSMPGLFAAGNTSDGAYISMGQALHICAVVGWYAGESAPKYASQAETQEPHPDQLKALEQRILSPMKVPSGVSFEEVRDALERLYGKEITHVSRGDRLEKALEATRGIQRDLVPRLFASDPRQLVKVHSMKNFTEILEVLLMVLLHRKESRGNVLREDFPYIDNKEWLKYTVVRKNRAGEIEIWDEPVPETGEYNLPERKRMRHPFFME